MSTFATQSRSASLMASLRVREPVCTAITVAPSSCMRATLRAWRSVSSSPIYTTHSIPKRAAAVAVATPCWPAPVSAIRRVLPIFFASSACPITLLILCEPVWFRSSRFKKKRTPPPCCEKRGTSVSRDGRLEYSWERRRNSARNSSSSFALLNVSSSSSMAAMRDSGIHCPPYCPK